MAAPILTPNYDFRYGNWTGGGYSAASDSGSFVPYTAQQEAVLAVDGFDNVSKGHDIRYEGAQQKFLKDIANGRDISDSVRDLQNGITQADTIFIAENKTVTADYEWGEQLRFTGSGAMGFKASIQMMISLLLSFMLLTGCTELSKGSQKSAPKYTRSVSLSQYPQSCEKNKIDGRLRVEKDTEENNPRYHIGCVPKSDNIPLYRTADEQSQFEYGYKVDRGYSLGVNSIIDIRDTQFISVYIFSASLQEVSFEDPLSGQRSCNVFVRSMDVSCVLYFNDRIVSGY
jgi:hypothetical protein